MNAIEFFELVKNMRKAQKKYFKRRRFADMEIAMNYETQVDAEIVRAEEVVKKRSMLPGLDADGK